MSSMTELFNVLVARLWKGWGLDAEVNLTIGAEIITYTILGVPLKGFIRDTTRAITRI